ncbi:MAG: hypothetical protein Q9208_001222 [Pyrenodesmia sp. 3 TL-2023]
MANPSKAARGSTGGKSYVRGSRLKQYGQQQRPNRPRRHHAAKSVNTMLPKVVSKTMRAQQIRRQAWMVQHHSAESVNNMLPQNPSRALLAQQLRRSAWHMARGLVLSSNAKKFRRVVKQQEKILERDSGHNGLDDGSSHQSSDGTKDDRLTIWHEHFHQIQETTRAAGHAWVRYCCKNGDWKYASGRTREEPSKQAKTDLLWHFQDLGPDTNNKPRSMLCREARSYLRMYDKLPIKGKPWQLAEWEGKELEIARFWMVMEMTGTSTLETEKRYGFVVTEEEEKRAMLALAPAPDVIGGVVSNGLQILPLPTNAAIHTPKLIEWTGVKDWAGVKYYDLPLRENPDLSRLPRTQVDYDVETDDDETADEEMETDDDLMEIDDDETGGTIEDYEETREALELVNGFVSKMAEEEEEAFIEDGVVPPMSRV